MDPFENLKKLLVSKEENKTKHKAQKKRPQQKKFFGRQSILKIEEAIKEEVDKLFKQFHAQDNVEQATKLLSLVQSWPISLSYLRPTVEDLNSLGSAFRQTGVTKVVSIGCGTGCYEWYLSKITGLTVSGVEAKYWLSFLQKEVFIERTFEAPSTYEGNTGFLLIFGYTDGVLPYYLKKYKEVTIAIIAEDCAGRATSLDLLQGNEEWIELTTHNYTPNKSNVLHFKVYQRISATSSTTTQHVDTQIPTPNNK